MPVRFPCGFCLKPVAITHKAIFCDICNFWVHKKCNNTSDLDYNQLITDDTNTWSCQKCLHKEMPFHEIPDEALKLTLEGKNSEFFDFLDPKQNMNISFFKDIETALSQTDMNTEIDCPYLTLSEFNSKKSKSFSCLHLNIASLKCHETEFNSLLQNSDIQFNIIGITETGYKDEEKAKNLGKLKNFNHFDKCTNSKKGGARLYIAKNLHSVEEKTSNSLKNLNLSL